MEGLMRFRFLLAIATVLAAVFGTSAAAFAYGAHTTTNLNVRSGPGASYARVGTLPAGFRVNVTGCEPGWCRIHGGGVSGWASSGYLSRAHVVRPPVIIVRPPHRPPHRPRPGKCKIAPGKRPPASIRTFFSRRLSR